MSNAVVVWDRSEMASQLGQGWRCSSSSAACLHQEGPKLLLFLLNLNPGSPADFMAWFNLPELTCSFWPPQQIGLKMGISKLLPDM